MEDHAADCDSYLLTTLRDRKSAPALNSTEQKLKELKNKLNQLNFDYS